LASLVSNSSTAELVGVVVGAFLCTNRVIAALLVLFFRKAEGGNVPPGAPKPAKTVDHLLVSTRFALRGARGDHARSARVLERGVRAVRAAAEEASREGYGDAVSRIVEFRRPCSGPKYVQDAWVQLLEAARQGVDDARVG
jgi:hypothetical protein